MAKRGGKQDVPSGNRYIVVETFTFDDMTPEVAYDILNGLDFGEHILVTGEPGTRNKAWRAKVILLFTPKILTVEVPYATNVNLMTDHLKWCCGEDAERVLAAIDTILVSNDVEGNNHVIQRGKPPAKPIQNPGDPGGKTGGPKSGNQ